MVRLVNFRYRAGWAAFSLLLLVAILASTLWMDGNPRNLTMKVATNFRKSIKSLDTDAIKTVYEYELLNNLYSRLVEYDESGRLVPGVASRYEFTDKSVIFHFDRNLTTVDGRPIGAADAEVSLKRLVIRGKSGHGDIRNLLCPGYKLSSMSDSCPGIEVRDNKLILTPVRPHFVSILVSALESADYAIIPLSSLSSDYASISDFRNTSGPYFVSHDDEEGYIVLETNPAHYRYARTMATKIELIPVGMGKGIEALVSGKVDVVPSSEYYSGEQAESILRDSNSYSVHASLPIRLTMTCFTPAALAQFTPAQRMYVARKYNSVVRRIFRVPGQKETNQFFQALSDGSLTEAQSQAVAQLNGGAIPNFNRPIEFGVREDFVEIYKRELADVPEIKIVSLPQSAYELPLNERPHAYLISTDSAWTENLSLLGHNFEMGIFHLPDMKPGVWLSSYLDTEDKVERIGRLNSLHYEILRQVAIAPNTAFPYYTVARLPWKTHMSGMSSSTNLWMIKAD